MVGGLFGAPLEVADCTTIDLQVPAAAEIVIEGEILPGVREPEGPFGEFTGYFSRRSTEHVFVARAIAMRERPWFQSIGSGRAGDHITTLGLVREAEIYNALTRVIPNVTGVHVPLSGTSSFTAYVAIKQGRPGEAKHVIPIVLGVDHYLKLLIVVDDDVDVFDEADVMWAVATRMQADRALVTIAGSLGAMLDPSADDRGVTAKLGIDATRPFGQPFAEMLVMDPARMAWARALVDRLGGRVPSSARFIVAVAFLIERDGRLLMLRRSATREHAPGEWECGSGRVEYGEEPETAVRREAREETGLEVEVISPVGAFHYYRGPAREEAICVAFHCRAVDGDLRLSEEHDAAEWVPLDRVAQVPVSQPMRGCLMRFVTRSGT